MGSTLDLPSITPPISPTPRGAGIPTQESPDINLPTIISYDSTPSPTLMSKPIVSGVSGGSWQILGTRTGGVESVDSTLIPNTVGISRINTTILQHTTRRPRRVVHIPHMIDASPHRHATVDVHTEVSG